MSTCFKWKESRLPACLDLVPKKLVSAVQRNTITRPGEGQGLRAGLGRQGGEVEGGGWHPSPFRGKHSAPTPEIPGSLGGAPYILVQAPHSLLGELPLGSSAPWAPRHPDGSTEWSLQTSTPTFFLITHLGVLTLTHLLPHTRSSGVRALRSSSLCAESQVFPAPISILQGSAARHLFREASPDCDGW